MKLSNNYTHGADVQVAFYVFIACVLFSFMQEAGTLLSNGIALLP